MKHGYTTIDIDLDLFYTNPNEYNYKACYFINEDPSIYKKLFSVVDNCDISTLESILIAPEYKECINFKDDDDDTCLHKAIFRGDIKICEILLKNGANINKIDKNGQSCFHRTIFSPTIEIIDLLVKYGADINQKDNEGNTLLHMAVITKNVELIKKLLEKGADKNIKNNYTYLPIDCIIDNDNKLYELLLFV